MPNYEKLYFQLFNAVTDVIEKLKNIQIAAEEGYLLSADTEAYETVKVSKDI